MFVSMNIIFDYLHIYRDDPGLKNPEVEVMSAHLLCLTLKYWVNSRWDFGD